jgi:hypothetical protein
MTNQGIRAFDCPERSAEHLLDRFAGDIATVERYIVDEELAAALRHDDYDSYLHWRCIKSICAGMAAQRRLEHAVAPVQLVTTDSDSRDGELASAA